MCSAVLPVVLPTCKAPDTDETKFFNSDTSPRLIILPSRDRDRFRDSESVQIETESETNTMK